jgi:hypothetical protein
MLQHDVCCALRSQQQPVATDLPETHSYRQSLVTIRVVGGEAGVLRQPRRAGTEQQLASGRILERGRQNGRCDRKFSGEPDVVPHRISVVFPGAQRIPARFATNRYRISFRLRDAILFVFADLDGGGLREHDCGEKSEHD